MPVAIDLTALVQAAVDAGQDSIAIQLRDETGTRTYRNDGASGTQKPSVTIVSEVPDPATMGLLVVGGLAALLRRRR